MAEVKDSGHIRLVGAIAGMGSGLSKARTTLIWHPRLPSSQDGRRKVFNADVDLLPGGCWTRVRMDEWMTVTKSTDALGHRFDTVKTRLQCSPPGTYRGAIDCLVKIVKNESPLALYKGATPPAVGWAAIDSVLLGSLHNYRLFLIRHGMTEPVAGTEIRRLSLIGHSVAGLGAGLTSAILATPIEHLKIRLQMQSQRAVADREFKGPLDCARQVVRSRGVLGLWSGFTGSLAFRANFCWMFGSVEILMRSFASLKGTSFEMSTGTANFLAGGLASFSFWIMAIPADNLKNRMMASPVGMPAPSFTSTMRHVYTTVGLRGFFAGLTPCFLRAFPTNACAYYAYEGLMRTFGAEKTRH